MAATTSSSTASWRRNGGPTVPVHNHGTEEGEGLACREVLVDGELKGACLREQAERTAVQQSDPHSFYCPECRTTYDFPWLRAQDCTCTPIQDFIVQHRSDYHADTKRRQIKSPADELHRRVFALLQDRWPAPVFGSDRQLQQINDLTAALIDALKLKREETLHSLLPDYERNTVRTNVWATRYVTEWTTDD
jgi:hypothetical protein